MPYRKFEMRLQELLFDSSKTMRELARASGKNYSTFMREISPWDNRAKLGIVTFIRLVRATHDKRLLMLLIEAAGFGYNGGEES